MSSPEDTPKNEDENQFAPTDAPPKIAPESSVQSLRDLGMEEETKSINPEPSLEGLEAPADVAEAPPQQQTPKTSERQRTPEEIEAEALITYFKDVKSGTDLIQSIIAMPESEELREIVDVAELSRRAGVLSVQVLTFLDQFQEGENIKSALDLMKLGEEFILSQKIPPGYQSAVRRIVHFASEFKQKQSLAKTPEKGAPGASPVPAKPTESTPGQSSAGTASKGPSNTEIVADYERMKAGQASSTSTNVMGLEALPPLSAQQQKKVRTQYWWNRTRGASTPEVSPVPSSALPSVASPSTSSVEGTSETATESEWAPERIDALTFEGIAELSDADFKRAILGGKGSQYDWGVALYGMPLPLVARFSALATANGISNSDLYLALSHFQSDAAITLKRAELLAKVKDGLREENI